MRWMCRQTETDRQGDRDIYIYMEYLLVVDPGGPQCLLELGQAHNVNVDELHHLVPLGGAAGLVPHHSPHDPARGSGLS